MTLYEVTSENFMRVTQTTFDQVGLRERTDLQRLLKKQIDVILPNTLVIAEEFSEWEESKRRIDLLALDEHANLVVIELKRTEEGGHMELQALRYAAMVSEMTFDHAVDIYGRYLAANGSSADPRAKILEFLGWEEPDEDSFAQVVKIVLVSANFSKELTTTVMWLNNKYDLDIRCIRLIPYQDGGRVLIDVQQVIPLPEAAEYQVRLKEKEQKERKEKAERLPLPRFWEQLLALGEGRTPLHVRMSPSERGYIGARIGVSGLGYWYNALQHTSRVEFYINRPDAAANKRMFDELLAHKEEIEVSFGQPLLWQRLDDKHASRIAYEINIGGYKDDEASWQTIHLAMIDAMVRLEKALSPFIQKIVRSS